MRRFTFMATPITGLTLIQRHPIGDQRGYLERLFCQHELATLLNGRAVLQVNRSYTANQGTVRGMHFQFQPHAEMKLVTCLHGEVFDVAVDLRRGSPTMLQWHGERLSADNHRTLLIPEGFAHGFQTLTVDCELLYLHTAAYSQESEGGLNALDPRLDIRWPLPLSEWSERDRTLPPLDAPFSGIEA